MRSVRIALVLVGCLIGGAAQAQNLIVNGGFESGPAAGGNQPVQVGQSSIAGWAVVNGSGSATGTGKEIAWLGDGAFGFNTPFGSDYLDLTGYAGSTGNSGVAQTVATVLGQAYTLNFYLGGMRGLGPISADVRAGSQSATFSDLITSGVLDTNTLWTMQSFRFVAESASTTLSIIGNTSGQDFIGLDEVSLTADATPPPVPEPASWAMMIGGLGLVGAVMRRRTREGRDARRRAVVG